MRKKWKWLLFQVLIVFALIFSTNTDFAEAASTSTTKIIANLKKQVQTLTNTIKLKDKQISTLTKQSSDKSKQISNLQNVIKSKDSTIQAKDREINFLKGLSQKDIDTLKFYSEMDDLYNNLDYLGEGLVGIERGLSLAFNEIIDSGKTDYLNTKVLEHFNNEINYYNESIDIVESKLNRAKALGLYNPTDEQNLNNILQLFSDSIDSYDLAFDNLNDYAVSHSTNDFDKYQANTGDGFDKSLAAREKAYDGYSTYLEMIQKYKK